MSKKTLAATIGSNIVKARKLANFSQPRLARELGFAGPPALSKIEKGTNSCSPERLYRICEVLGVTPNGLFGYEPLAVIRAPVIEAVLNERDALWVKYVAPFTDKDKLVMRAHLARQPTADPIALVLRVIECRQREDTNLSRFSDAWAAVGCSLGAIPRENFDNLVGDGRCGLG